MTGAFVLGEVTAYWIGKMAGTGNGGLMAPPGLPVLIALLFAIGAAVCALFRFLKESWGGRFLYSVRGLLQRYRMRKRPVIVLSGMFLFFAAGAGRMAAEMRPWPMEKQLEMEGECRVSVRGRLREESVKNGSVTLILEQAEIWTEGEGREWQEEVKGETSEMPMDLPPRQSAEAQFCLPRLMVSLKEAQWKGNDAVPGMEFWFTGSAGLFDGPRNPGEFDYRLYYRSKKLRVRIRGEEVAVVSSRTTPYQRMVRFVRTHTGKILEDTCTPEDAGVYRALLLGDQTALSEEVRGLYQESGIAHLLAVSGLHVSLIGMGFYGLLRRFGLGYGTSGLLSGAVLLFYGGLTGFGPSVFRALVMIFCSFAAAHLGRTYDLLTAMALSLFLLALDAPYQLFAGGVQLSFAAVAAIGIGNELSRKRRKEKKKLSAVPLAGTLWISFCIQLATFPILLYHFFEFPVYGILLNLIVLPLMAYVVGSGLLVIFLGSLAQGTGAAATGSSAVFPSLFPSLLPSLLPAARLFETAARAAVGPGHYLLEFYRVLCEAVLRLPFHTLTPGRPSVGRILLYYLLVGAALFIAGPGGTHWVEAAGSGNGIKTAWKRNGLAAVLGIYGCLSLLIRPVSGLEADILDVGQGDGIYLETGEVKILVDGGSSQIKNLGKNRLTPFLKSRGASRLDCVFVTHGDLDHLSGIRYVLEEDEIWTDCLVFSCLSRDDEACKELAKLQRARGGEVRYMEAGEAFTKGELRLDCLYPLPDSIAADKNDQSLVLLVSYEDFSMLLTGDLEQDGEEQMMKLWENRSAGSAPILKAGHHGSKTSTSEELLHWLRPRYAVLSYGEGNSYGHPSAEVVERLTGAGVELWSTAVSGMVSVRTDGRRTEIDGFVKEK